jgi:DNA helicase HerA-like ATPase
MVTGTRGEKQGPFHGKLTRFIQRLQSKASDRRLGFLFSAGEDAMRYEWMEELATVLLGSTTVRRQGGVKILDFSEVPSDILPLIIGLVARVVFSVQQWTEKNKWHPVALLCDEAHLYIPERRETGVAEEGLKSFERIAKEGRKYGVGLTVISQRPAEVNRTVLSQCNNFVAMRLTNAEDQTVIRRLLPDTLGGFAELLPVLDVGEALIVGDAAMLPSRIRIDEPTNHLSSATVQFWDRWAEEIVENGIPNAVESLRKQRTGE